MADGESNGAGAEERKPTERVIFERIVAMRIPAEASEEQVQAAMEALYPKARKAERAAAGAVGEAWREVSRRVAPTKVGAVEAYAGKAGTADAKVGTFRAPTSTAWKGAIVYDAPPQPLVQRSLID